MAKYVYLLFGGSYEDYIINAVKGEPNVFVFQSFNREIVKKLHMLHNARPLNEKKELPFKAGWFKRALKGMELKREETIYFLLYESFHLSYSRKFMVFLKERYPNCKICFMYLNPVTELISSKLQKVADYLDAVVTFNEKDAKLNNYLFAPIHPYKLTIHKDESVPESDVFFVGANKGRLSKLLAIYENLTEAGLKCDFHIVGVAEEEQKYRDDIIYNQTISYQEVLARVYATKCVLEVLQMDEDYCSIRTLEAFQYHKKLLTESKSVMKLSFYNPEIIQVFDNPKDINVGFVRNKVEESVFLEGYQDGVKDFHEFLCESI